MQVKAKVLECQSGTAKGSGRAYTIALVQIAGGRTGKIFSQVDLTPYIGKDVLAELSVTPNREMFLSVGITEASLVK